MKSFKTLLALFVIVHHVNSNVVVNVELAQNVNFGSKNDGSEDNGSEDFGTSELSDGPDCAWYKDVDFPTNAPILLNSDFQMVLPVKEGKKRVVRVPAGTELTIACSGGSLIELDLEAVKGTCVGKKLINIKGTKKKWTMTQLGCSEKVKSSIRKDQGSSGAANGNVVYAIGFDIKFSTTDKFYELIKVCLDPVAETTIYSQHTVHGVNIATKDTNTDMDTDTDTDTDTDMDMDMVTNTGSCYFKTFKEIFKVSMSKVYEIDSQLERMKTLLKSETLAHEMIDKCEVLFFAKGHMAPRADFATEVERDATCYYINAVPQWQTFNNGNWKQLEEATRNLAKDNVTDLTVYTGTFEVLKLNDTYGTPMEIYLGLNQSKKVVPAPALIWKVVHDKSRNKAVAVVGINNPHITEAPLPICYDICSSIEWLNRKQFDNLKRGYTYCCSVQNLTKAIPFIPDLGDVQLLKS